MSEYVITAWSETAVSAAIGPGNTVEVVVEAGSLVEVTVLAGAPGPPGADKIVLGETPSGAINGSNATFTTAHDFVPGQVVVRVNGLGQEIISDFQTVGTRTITLNVSPGVGEKVQVDYKRV